jgi:gliding motility-associated lipoprotein GldD
MRYTVLFFITLLFCACKEEVFTPKPRGYFAVPFPKKSYQPFQEQGYPYRFEYPVYARVDKDTMFFDQKTENPWWINIHYPTLGGTVYLSYKEINAKQSLGKLLEDSYFMSHYHTKKADYMNEPVFHTANGVHGIYYEVGGNAASAFQFYATDSVKHFIRGALYFSVTPNMDSLKPINNFIIQDIEHLIKTLNWTR